MLILASLADGPKHGDALIKNVQNVVATALGRARCPRHSPAFSSGLIEALPEQNRRRPDQLTPAGAEAARAYLRHPCQVTAIHLRRLEEDTCRASALYPARWRQRDGTEMAASSITRRRSSGAGLRVVADLIRGALAGHVSKELRMTSKPGRVVRRGVIVVLIAWVLSG